MRGGKMKFLAIALRVIATVFLFVAAFRLATALSSSLEIDTTQNGDLTTIDHHFAIDRGPPFLD
jgi:hypothetical protein